MDEILQLARQRGVLTARDLRARGIAATYVKRLCDRGLLVRSSRGIYVPADCSIVTEHHSLAEVCERIPRAIICLLSALRFRNITTQNPFEVWIALPRNARTPVPAWPPLRVFHFSDVAYSEGVEEHTVEGVTIRVYSAAKTVADCFKFRHQIGLDAALEALRETWQTRQASMDEIWHHAKNCRVDRVMLPYVEAMAASGSVTARRPPSA